MDRVNNKVVVEENVFHFRGVLLFLKTGIKIRVNRKISRSINLYIISNNNLLERFSKIPIIDLENFLIIIRKISIDIRICAPFTVQFDVQDDFRDNQIRQLTVKVRGNSGLRPFSEFRRAIELRCASVVHPRRRDPI